LLAFSAFSALWAFSAYSYLMSKTSGLYYKHVTIINDDSSVITK